MTKDVGRLKSVGGLETEFVAPIPEQIATTTMHFSDISEGGIYPGLYMALLRP